jgi:hypothetical protein
MEPMGHFRIGNRIHERKKYCLFWGGSGITIIGVNFEISTPLLNKIMKSLFGVCSRDEYYFHRFETK